MKNGWHLFTFCTVLFGVFFNTHAQTIISGGNVSGIWTAANSPYIVQNDVLVPDGDTLIVEPGTLVEFGSGVRLDVEGIIRAEGTQVDSIRFTAQNSNNDWEGLGIIPVSAATDSSILEYCIFEYGNGLIFIGAFDKVRIEHCLIQNGSTASNGAGLAAVGTAGGSFIIRNNVFRDNHAPGQGGAILIGGVSSTHVIQNNLFLNNSALGVGGAISFNGNESATISQNVFQGNSAAFGGGAISLGNNSNNLIDDNLFIGNAGNDRGGVINGTVTSAIITNNSFINNTCTGEAGVYQFLFTSTPVLSGNYYEGNSCANASILSLEDDAIAQVSNEVYNANLNGPPISVVFDAELNMQDCIFSNNQGFKGGAIEINNSTVVTVYNSLFVNNEAAWGGAISCSGGMSQSFTNCTFANNHATIDGGMLHLYAGADPVFTNCIVDGNTSAGAGSVLFVQGSHPSSNDPQFINCLIEGGASGFNAAGILNPTLTNVIDVNPQFVLPTTGSGNGFNGNAANWKLQSTSLCINGGTTDTTGLSLPSTDLAGWLRIVTDTVDIGAYETQLEVNVVGIYADTNLCSNLDSAIFNVLVTGSGPTSYQWQFNGTDLVGETNDTLVRNAVLANQGDYRCIVTNPQGSDTSVAVIANFYAVQPLASLGADTAFCAGDSILLVADNGSYTYDWNNGLSSNDSLHISIAGDYFFEVTDANNCVVKSDTISITTNNLPVFDLGSDIEICDSTLVSIGTSLTDVTYYWNSGLSINDSIDVSTSGDYVLEVLDTNNCSFSDTVNVLFHPTPTVEIVGDTLCEGQSHIMNVGSGFSSYLWNNGLGTSSVLTVTTTGSYFIEVVDFNGCQAFDTTNVLFNINPTPDLGMDTSICAGDSIDLTAGDTYASYNWNNGFSTDSMLTIGASGQWIIEVVDTNSCSGSDTFNLTVNTLPSIFTGNSITLCFGDSAVLGGIAGIASYNWNSGQSIVDTFVVNTSGWVEVDLVDNNNCSNVDSLLVDVLPLSMGADVQMACDSFTWIDGLTYTSSNNTAQWVLTNAQGCDSLAMLDLTITNSSIGTDVITACDSFVWIDGNTYTTSNNTAHWILTNSQGCDSVITLNLIINTANAIVTSNDPELIADLGATSYQWLDCLNGNTPISGATSNVFVATVNGQYAVVIEENGCIDTSDCFIINNVGLSEITSQNWKLYPNPTDDIVTIKFYEVPLSTRVEVTNPLGQVISKQAIYAQEVDLALGENSGVYFVRLISEESTIIIPVIKK